MDRFLGLAVVAILLVLGAVVYVHLDRPVVRVSVTGALDDAEREQIRSAVRSHLSGGLLSADLEGLSAGILSLSWPRAVTIRRSWPGALSIDVEKPAVVAAWQDAYLASDGRIVHLPGRRDDLPRFECSIAEPRLAMEIYHRLSQAGARVGLSIDRVTENPLGEWGLSLHDDGGAGTLTVVLGAESVEERFDRFLVVYRQQLAGRLGDIARVDARYDNGVAVSWAVNDPEGALVAARQAGTSGSI